jgi:serine/threonine protein phosphatase PrpC
MRRQNEDRYLRDENLRAFGVADGVGGLPGGEQAAQAAIEGITQALARHKPQRAAQLVPLVLHVNEAVNELGANVSPGVGIATTLTFGVCTTEELLLAHVGDSRCYLLRGGRFMMLTEDHSVENEARHRRARGEFAGFAERYRNALTRCIGQPTRPEVDVSAHDLAPGDLYLFATDGITRVLTDQEIAEIIGGKATLEARLSALINRANERGGPDNATAVLLSVEARG